MSAAKPVTLEEHREAGNTVIRWAVFNTDKRGERVLTFPCWGRYTFATKAEAESAAFDLQSANGEKRLVECYGAQAIGTFRASRVECWAGHFDPVGIYERPELQERKP